MGLRSFMQPVWDCGLVAPAVKQAANTALVSVIGGVSVGVISYIAFKALGFSAVIAGSVAAIPVGLGMLGAMAAAGVSVALMLAAAVGLSSFGK